MIGKIIGAFAGSKMAATTRSVGGPAGAMLGVGAAALMRRMSIPGLIAMSVGGYFVKKYMDGKDEVAAPPSSKAKAADAKPVKAKPPKVTPTAL